jgi:hypothetical protein
MRTIKFLVAVSAIVGVIGGCASTHMKQYVGKDVREIVINSGAPENAFDLGDGRRVFQFRWGGGTFVVPQTTTFSGSTSAIGNSAWYSGSAITTGGGVVSSPGCLLSYIATWDSAASSWVVDEVRVPKQLVC